MEQLIMKFRLQSIRDLSLVDDIISIGYKKTGNKFSIEFNGSKGYLSNINVACEGVQKERNNVIWIENLITKKCTLKSKMVEIYHSKERGIRVSV